MEKLIIKITAATFFTVLSFTSFAQKAEQKPVIAESDKNTSNEKIVTALTAPQIVAAPKAMTIKEQPKSIVPGGEFKPTDTNGPVKNYSKTSEAEAAPTPVKTVLQQQR